ncbi:MAG: folate-binding protein [Hyphomicrobiales bacterium]|nr:folate-binding protein [Hyphomicrobiales bacterium]MDE2115996.1 folate-binding protein YgfZ [Hyphomicrobiales bacterium]
MTSVYLDNRGWLKVTGGDAPRFLQDMLTNDVLALTNGEMRYAALLSPQGKILFDFMVLRENSDFLIDVTRSMIQALAKRFGMYKLRADVAILDISADFAVRAGWGEPKPAGGVDDPRMPEMGWRQKVARQPEGDILPYVAHRIRLCVPEGGQDFVYGDAFPHEANMDRLHGIDFKKGCYVGQEVVSRVEHRGLARKRVIALKFAGKAPAAGADVVANGTVIGTVGSTCPGVCLAMVRLDRLVEAGGTCTADGVELAADSAALPLPNANANH